MNRTLLLGTALNTAFAAVLMAAGLAGYGSGIGVVDAVAVVALAALSPLAFYAVRGDVDIRGALGRQDVQREA